MKRDPLFTEANKDDPLRLAVGLPIGTEAGYYVGPAGNNGQEDMWSHHGSPGAKGGIIDSNSPPDGQPSLWCPWEPTNDGGGYWIEYQNKHYHYIEWAQYLLDHFLTPWGYKLSGRIDWQGEDESDTGYMVIYSGKVFVNEDPVLEKLADAL